MEFATNVLKMILWALENLLATTNGDHFFLFVLNSLHIAQQLLEASTLIYRVNV